MEPTEPTEAAQAPARQRTAATVPALDLGGDVVDLAAALVDVSSVSGDERALADAVEAALRALPHLRVDRDGDAVVARTIGGAPSRVLVAGHLDTVPIADNVPSRRELRDGREWLVGRGSVDMKGGVATQLALAAAISDHLATGASLDREVTVVLYDHEEVDSALNGLGRLARNHPGWLACDAAVLGEPTSAGVEGGCQGTLRAEVRLTGRAAHSARAWRGVNAVHAAAGVLARLTAHEPRVVDVDGLTYREGLQAVGITGGHAGNVVPDACTVTVNHRFAPDRDVAAATDHVREVLEGYEVVVTDAAGGARPGLDRPEVATLVAASGREPTAKLGWTDVARFADAGVPAVNYGPGDPLACHTDDEACATDEIRECAAVLLAWVRGDGHAVGDRG